MGITGAVVAVAVPITRATIIIIRIAVIVVGIRLIEIVLILLERILGNGRDSFRFLLSLYGLKSIRFYFINLSIIAKLLIQAEIVLLIFDDSFIKIKRFLLLFGCRREQCMFHLFEAAVVVIFVGIQIDVGFSNKVVVVVIVGMGKCFFVRTGIAGRIGSWGWMFWFFINLHLEVSSNQTRVRREIINGRFIMIHETQVETAEEDQEEKRGEYRNCTQFGGKFSGATEDRFELQMLFDQTGNGNI